MITPEPEPPWFKMNLELEMALNYANFSGLARVLIGYVFLQIGGRGIRPTQAFLPRNQLIGRTRQKRQNVYRAMEELIGSGVLVDRKYDLYDFVPDYEKWLTWNRDPAKCGHPRLTKTEIQECQESIAYAEFFRIKGPVKADAKPAPETASVNAIMGNPNGCGGIQMDANPESKRIPGVIQIDSPGIQIDANGIQIDSGAIDERARVQRELEILNQRARDARAHSKVLARQERWTLAEMKAEDSRIAEEFGIPIMRLVMMEEARKQEERERMRKENR
jgi:hypothetical protein